MAEQALLVRLVYSFDQLMGVCNSRLWVEKPFVLAKAKKDSNPDSNPDPEDEGHVRIMPDPFDLGALLRHATQRELMLLPSMGYGNLD